MSCFQDCSGTTACPDPAKRVNYVEGMLLGADDFVQDQAHHRARLHGLAREAIGYGTLSGLGLSTRAGDRGPEVSVTPGVGLTPRGELVRLCEAQCASLNDWLARDDVRAALLEQQGGASPPAGGGLGYAATALARVSISTRGLSDQQQDTCEQQIPPHSLCVLLRVIRSDVLGRQ